VKRGPEGRYSTVPIQAGRKETPAKKKNSSRGNLLMRLDTLLAEKGRRRGYAVGT